MSAASAAGGPRSPGDPAGEGDSLRGRIAVLVGAATRLLADPVLTVVFPSSCPACHAVLARPTQGPLCAPCWASLPRHAGPACACGLPLGRPGACARCRRGRSPVTRGASAGPYVGALRLAVHELKYRGQRRAARGLALRLLEEPAVRSVLHEATVLVPVPLHPRRLAERGFNQAALLARAVAEAWGVPVREDLRRERDTPPQTGRSAAARRSNVARAFAAVHPFHGDVVVLVDDVVTTGATARACARALLAAGAHEVRVLSAARVS